MSILLGIPASQRVKAHHVNKKCRWERAIYREKDRGWRLLSKGVEMSDLVNRSCNTATTITKGDALNLLSGSYINQIKVGGNTGVIRGTA